MIKVLEFLEDKKVSEYFGSDETKRPKVLARCFADTKEEVVKGAVIEGLPVGCVLAPGSTVSTADFNHGKIDSNGVWHWKEDGGGGSATLIAKNIVENGIYNASNDNADGYSTVNVDVPGGSGSSIGDVNFYDYNGELIESYSKSEFLELEDMPENPIHTGLISQGWNWELSDAKAYVTANNRLDIGQSYVTNDGKTRIYITLSDEIHLSPTLNIGLEGVCTIDWGDNTVPDVIEEHAEEPGHFGRVSISHTYQNTGDYIITLSFNEFSLGEIGTTNLNNLRLLLSSGIDDDPLNEIPRYAHCITKINLGSNIQLDKGCFIACTNLRSITIPTNITTINDASFAKSGIRFVVIPKTVQTISKNGTFTSAMQLTEVIFPANISIIGNDDDIPMFTENNLLKTVIIPPSIESIPNSFCYLCSALTEIILPSEVTDIGDWAFSGCNLTSVVLKNTIENIGDWAFSSSFSLESITIPNGITKINDGVCSECISLSSITIPTTVTEIGEYAFGGCTNLLGTLVIPNSVTAISSDAFAGCNFGMIRFNPVIPPTVGEGAFSNLPVDCEISVPNGSYLSAENYPDPEVYTYLVDGR